MAQQELTQEQVAERVAILKRFRQLLEEQRNKFREYLSVLEKQEDMIHSDNVDAMVRHTEIEQSIIAEIYTIQKVIDPMEELVKTINPAKQDTEIPKIKTDLEHLRKEVLQQNEKNRDLLKSHMQTLRQQVLSMKNPYAGKQSIYASGANSASVIDIES
ncbi:flagellar protein FlgN [Brucepastera parasyntrophica]|uniref:flagellar export chaperone FlgN n=1 Tax=Brucepastera parasyntrophica TaxID=2880008 RepID=UPI00210EE2A3|nr:flagellar export chaperone FlgN [Brucepastera parasyntrophica]ULQ60745.1 flagellar protein FlgN [Brucepastera parasyntrophica]